MDTLQIASDTRPPQIAPTPRPVQLADQPARGAANKSWRSLTRGLSHILMIPVLSAATTGRGVAIALSVLRYSVIDAILLRLPFGEMVVEAWALLKVTATP